jgi:hypothetical protein
MRIGCTRIHPARSVLIGFSAFSGVKAEFRVSGGSGLATEFVQRFDWVQCLSIWTEREVTGCQARDTRKASYWIARMPNDTLTSTTMNSATILMTSHVC